MDSNKKAMYLKVNRGEDFAIKNLSRWIDASFLLGIDCYVVCDDDSLKDKIINRLIIYRKIEFIKSNKGEELTYIVKNIANRNWINAAYAHLTTFYDSREKYDYFWNIDADDTRFCVSIDRMVQILKGVEEYALNNQIGCFSLDMWRSETLGKHWSFGITYVSNAVDWLSICRDRCCDKEYYLLDKEGNQNIDWFFTYLKSVIPEKIETFCVENLKFLHYSNDFFEKPIGSGMYHWKSGKLIYPLVYYGYGINDIGIFDIAEDVITLRFDITDKEASEVMTFYAREGKDLRQYYDINSIVNTEICKAKFEEFKKKYERSGEREIQIVCFGAGNALEKNIDKIRKIFDLKYVSDNDSDKWGKEYFGGVKCIPPEELNSFDNLVVVILVYSKRIVLQIANQLDAMNIEHVTLDKLMLCVE